MRILDFADGFESAVQPTIVGVAASSISVTPTGNISSTNVQSALAELDSEKIAKVSSTDNTLPRFDGTGGDVQTSGVVVDDSNNVSGVNNLTANGTSQNIGTSNSATTVNIANGTGANVINIGGANSQINITGTIETQNVTNMDVADKLVTINKGGSAGSGAVAGISIEEGGSETGYIKTSADRNSMTVKAPNTAGIVSITPGASNDEAVLLAKAQTLSNKTFSDPVILAEQSGTPSTPSSGFKKLYAKNDGKVYTKDSAGLEKQVGSGAGGGSKNYLGNINGTDNGGDFENNTVGNWVLGNSTLDSTLKFPNGTPTFGSGASGNLAGSIVSSGQLAGSYSYSYASSAATTAGNFLASPAFTIDTEDQAKVLTFKFAYKAVTNPSNATWSGTNTNSFGVAIYDVTTGGSSGWIMPAGCFAMTQSSGVGICTGTFQTTSSSTQYRLVVYNANATLGAVTVYFDDFSVSPVGPAADGRVIACYGGSQVPSTPASGSAINFTATKDTNAAYSSGTYTIPVSGWYQATANVEASVSSASIDQAIWTIITLSGSNISGSNWIATGSIASTVVVNMTPTCAFYANAGQTVQFIFRWNTTGSPTLSGSLTGSSFSISRLAGPTSGDEGRVVAFRTGGNPTATVTSSLSTVVWATAPAIDTGGNYSTGTGKFTVSVSGVYEIAVQAAISGTFAASNYGQVTIMQNSTNVGSNIQQVAGSGTGTVYPSTSTIVNAVAGDTLYIQVLSTATSPTLVASSSTNYFTVKRVSGPNAVSAQETVKARYTSTAGTSIATGGGNTSVPYPTKDYDSHAAFNGATGVFTAPISGTFRVTVHTAYASAAWTLAVAKYAILQKNSSDDRYLWLHYPAASSTTALAGTGSAEIYLNAGETINVHLNHGEGTSRSLDTGAGLNDIAIVRVGN
jgi:hypothetical protein